MVGTVVVRPVQAADAELGLVGAEQGWWSSKWHFRMPILLVNSINVSRTVPVFFYLSFQEGQLQSAFNELRLVENGMERPSYILYESYDLNRFVKGAYLLTFLDFRGEEKKTIYAYYGNPSSTPPEYRRSASAPATSTGVQISLDESSGVFSDAGILINKASPLQVYETVKIGSWLHSNYDYGSPQLASNQLAVVKDWQNVMNFTQTGVSGLNAVFKADDLSLVRTVISRGSDVWLSDLVVNEGVSIVDDLVLYDVYDSGSYGGLSWVTGSFTPTNQRFMLQTRGLYLYAWFGESIHSVSVQDRVEVYRGVRESGLDGSMEHSGTVGAAFSYRLKNLAPNEAYASLRVLSIGSNTTAIDSNLGIISPKILVYPLYTQLPDTPIPTASVAFDVDLQLTNVTLSKGLRANLNLSSVSWIANSLGMGGEVVYSLPDPANSGFEFPSIWVARTNTTRASALASTSYEFGSPWDHIGTVGLRNEDEKGTASALLRSNFIPISDAMTLNLKLNHRTTILQFRDGNYSVRVGAGFDYDLDGLVDRWVYLTSGNSVFPKNDVIAYLEEGDWRDLNVDLTDFINLNKPFQVMFDIAVFCDSPFKGFLQLDIGEIMLEVKAQPQYAVRAILNPYSSLIDIVPSTAVYPTYMRGDLDLSFTLVAAKDMTYSGKGQFTYRLDNPQMDVSLQPKLSGANVTYTLRASRGQILTSLYGNITSVESTASKSMGIGVVSLKGGSQNSSINLAGGVSLVTRDLKVLVLDAGRTPLMGAGVQITDGFGRILYSSNTDYEGGAYFELPPSLYQIRIIYQDIEVSKAKLDLTSDSSVNMNTVVYRIGLRILDGLGMPLQNANVKILFGGKGLHDAYTDARGDVGVSLLGQQWYNLEVNFEGSTVYSAPFTVTLDRATIVIGTAYYPLWFQLSIVAIVGVAAVISGYLFWAKKMKVAH
jgi:hypothetical protein